MMIGGRQQQQQALLPTPEQRAALAELLLNGGRAAEALAVVDAALLAAPTSARLRHLHGACLLAAGNVPGAYAALASLVADEPTHVPALVDLAGLLKGRGLLREARDALERAAAAAPSDAGVAEALATVLTDLGTAAKSAGRAGEAASLYRAALAAWPQFAAAHYNLGVVASEAGRDSWPDALAHYRRAVACDPQYAQAHCNLGVILRELGDLEGAVASYERALRAAPTYELVRANLAAALTDLGTARKAAGDAAAGIALYERALALAPGHADAHYNLGVALAEPGPHRALDRALFCYHAAAGLRPGCAEAWNNAGVVYRERGELERAAECYLAALSARPAFPQALNNLGVIYTSQGRAGEATALLVAATRAAPSYAEAWNNLGVAQRDIGAVSDAVESYARAAALAPTQDNAAQNRLLALNYAASGDEPWVCDEHAAWGSAFQARVGQLPPVDRAARRAPQLPRIGSSADATGDDASPSVSDQQQKQQQQQQSRRQGRRLHVGYVSPDLFTHSVSYFAEAPLSRHDPSRFRVTVYDSTPRRDLKSEHLRARAEAAGATWRCVDALDDAALADLVRADGVDVVVELTGHTAHNRLGALARRPAPVAVTWIGYPNTTGLAAVDYRLTDGIADPVDTKQRFVERLVRLPGCFLCYTPPTDAPPVAPLPAHARGYVTFGSFNALAKVTDEVLRVWARVLAAVPGSRLVLKNKPFACAQARALWMARLAAHGVEAWRVDLLPLAATNAEHLAQYALVDVALDPFPYAGTTTTAEALLMGVPVISLRGRCHAQNVGASLLRAVGLDGGEGSSGGGGGEGSSNTSNSSSNSAASGWVVATADEYVARAAAAAADLQGLSELRAGMRARVLGSALCDAPRFMRGLEAAYERMWAAWLAGGGGEAGAVVEAEAEAVAGGDVRVDPSKLAAAKPDNNNNSACSSDDNHHHAGGGSSGANSVDGGGGDVEGGGSGGSSSGRSSRACYSRLGSAGSGSDDDCVPPPAAAAAAAPPLQQQHERHGVKRASES